MPTTAPLTASVPFRKPEVTIWNADHQAEARFDTGSLQHTTLVGIDYQHSVTDSRSASRFRPRRWMSFDPVYGTFDPSGVTLCDQFHNSALRKRASMCKTRFVYQNWLATLGLRKDWADTRVENGTRQKTMRSPAAWG
ncbi:MAG: hypothetical protein ACWGHV_17510 [Stutzerimonas stutzeri]